MSFVTVKPLSLCSPEFINFSSTDNIIVHRTLYSDLMSKILTQPYYIVKISRFENSKNIIACLGGVHGDNPEDVYVPDWLYRNLLDYHGDMNEELYCQLEYNTQDLLTIEPVHSCKIKVNIAENIDVDLRTAIEISLTERRILKVGDVFEFRIVELGNIIEEGEILELKNISGDFIDFAYVGMNSEVSLELETVPAPEPEPEPVPEPEPEPVPASEQQLSSEERRRIIRESWLKYHQHLENTSSS